MADSELGELMRLVNDLIRCLPEVQAMELLMSLRDGNGPLASEIKNKMRSAGISSGTEEAGAVDQADRVGVDQQLITLIGEGKVLLARLSEEEIFNLLGALQGGGSPVAAAIRGSTTWNSEEISEQPVVTDEEPHWAGSDGLQSDLLELIAEGRSLLEKLSQTQIYELMVALMKGTSPLATSIRQHPRTRFEPSRSEPSSGRASRVSSGRVSRVSSGGASRVSECEGQLEELMDEGRQLISGGGVGTAIPRVEDGQFQERLMKHMGLRGDRESKTLDDMEETEASSDSQHEVAAENSNSGYSDSFDDENVVTRPEGADAEQTAKDAKLPALSQTGRELRDSNAARMVSLPVENSGDTQTAQDVSDAKADQQAAEEEADGQGPGSGNSDSFDDGVVLVTGKDDADQQVVENDAREMLKRRVREMEEALQRAEAKREAEEKEKKRAVEEMKEALQRAEAKREAEEKEKKRAVEEMERLRKEVEEGRAERNREAELAREAKEETERARKALGESGAEMERLREEVERLGKEVIEVGEVGRREEADTKELPAQTGDSSEARDGAGVHLSAPTLIEDGVIPEPEVQDRSEELPDEGQPSSDPLEDIACVESEASDSVQMCDAVAEEVVENADGQGSGSGYSDSFDDEVDVARVPAQSGNKGEQDDGTGAQLFSVPQTEARDNEEQVPNSSVEEDIDVKVEAGAEAADGVGIGPQAQDGEFKNNENQERATGGNEAETSGSHLQDDSSEGRWDMVHESSFKVPRQMSAGRRVQPEPDAGIAVFHEPGGLSNNVADRPDSQREEAAQHAAAPVTDAAAARETHRDGVEEGRDDQEKESAGREAAEHEDEGFSRAPSAVAPLPQFKKKGRKVPMDPISTEPDATTPKAADASVSPGKKGPAAGLPRAVSFSASSAQKVFRMQREKRREQADAKAREDKERKLKEQEEERQRKAAEEQRESEHLGKILAEMERHGYERMVAVLHEEISLIQSKGVEASNAQAEEETLSARDKWCSDLNEVSATASPRHRGGLELASMEEEQLPESESAQPASAGSDAAKNEQLEDQFVRGSPSAQTTLITERHLQLPLVDETGEDLPPLRIPAAQQTSSPDPEGFGSPLRCDTFRSQVAIASEAKSEPVEPQQEQSVSSEASSPLQHRLKSASAARSRLSSRGSLGASGLTSFALRKAAEHSVRDKFEAFTAVCSTELRSPRGAMDPEIAEEQYWMFRRSQHTTPATSPEVNRDVARRSQRLSPKAPSSPSQHAEPRPNTAGVFAKATSPLQPSPPVRPRTAASSVQPFVRHSVPATQKRRNVLPEPAAEEPRAAVVVEDQTTIETKIQTTIQTLDRRSQFGGKKPARKQMSSASKRRLGQDAVRVRDLLSSIFSSPAEAFVFLDANGRRTISRSFFRSRLEILGMQVMPSDGGVLMPQAGGVNLEDIFRDVGAPADMGFEEFRRLFLRGRIDGCADGDDGGSTQGFSLFVPLETAEDRRPEICMKGNQVVRELTRRRKANLEAEQASIRKQNVEDVKSEAKPPAHFFYREMSRKTLAVAEAQEVVHIVRQGVDFEVGKAIAIFKKHFRDVAEAFVYINMDMSPGGITLVDLKRVFIRLRCRGQMNCERLWNKCGEFSLQTRLSWSTFRSNFHWHTLSNDADKEIRHAFARREAIHSRVVRMVVDCDKLQEQAEARKSIERSNLEREMSSEREHLSQIRKVGEQVVRHSGAWLRAHRSSTAEEEETTLAVAEEWLRRLYAVRVELARAGVVYTAPPGEEEDSEADYLGSPTPDSAHEGRQDATDLSEVQTAVAGVVSAVIQEVLAAVENGEIGSLLAVDWEEVGPMRVAEDKVGESGAVGAGHNSSQPADAEAEDSTQTAAADAAAGARHSVEQDAVDAAGGHGEASVEEAAVDAAGRPQAEDSVEEGAPQHEMVVLVRREARALSKVLAEMRDEVAASGSASGLLARHGSTGSPQAEMLVLEDVSGLEVREGEDHSSFASEGDMEPSQDEGGVSHSETSFYFDSAGRLREVEKGWFPTLFRSPHKATEAELFERRTAERRAFTPDVRSLLEQVGWVKAEESGDGMVFDPMLAQNARITPGAGKATLRDVKKVVERQARAGLEVTDWLARSRTSYGMQLHKGTIEKPVTADDVYVAIPRRRTRTRSARLTWQSDHSKNNPGGSAEGLATRLSRASSQGGVTQSPGAMPAAMSLMSADSEVASPSSSAPSSPRGNGARGVRSPFGRRVLGKVGSFRLKAHSPLNQRGRQHRPHQKLFSRLGTLPYRETEDFWGHFLQHGGSEEWLEKGFWTRIGGCARSGEEAPAEPSEERGAGLEALGTRCALAMTGEVVHYEAGPVAAAAVEAVVPEVGSPRPKRGIIKQEGWPEEWLQGQEALRKAELRRQKSPPRAAILRKQHIAAQIRARAAVDTEDKLDVRFQKRAPKHREAPEASPSGTADGSHLSSVAKITRLGSASKLHRMESTVSHASRVSSTASRGRRASRIWDGSEGNDDLQRLFSGSMSAKREASMPPDWLDAEGSKPIGAELQASQEIRAMAERLQALNKVALIRTLRQEKDVLVQALLQSERRPLEPSETVEIRERLAEMRRQLLAMT